METLIQWDTALFRFINEGLSNSLFDATLPWCRERWFWAPLYLFVAVFSWLNFGRRGWLLVLGIGAAVALADFTSSTLIKKNVQRLRPCNDPALRAEVRLRVAACGSGYSFTSSHAANHFAAAVFLIGMFGHLSRRVRPALLLWASSIALAQVYVGVHYPADVLCGAGLGAAVGWWTTVTWRRWIMPNLR
jgi:membrane-associated phospholipid phosphatase